MLLSGPRVGHRRITMTLAVTALLALLAGCAATGVAPEPFTAERSTRGGLCPEGPCQSQLVVEGDGAWRYSADDGESEGQLTADELSRLRDAVLQTGLAKATTASTHCAEHSDGTSFGYSWTVDGQQHAVDSCRVQIDAGDSLVQALDELAERAERVTG